MAGVRTYSVCLMSLTVLKFKILTRNSYNFSFKISLLRWSVNTQVQNSDVNTSLCGYSSVSGAWINGVCTIFERSGNCKCYILKFKFLLFIEWTSAFYHVLFWVIIWNKTLKEKYHKLRHNYPFRVISKLSW